ncbi:valine--tRNA ligase [Candidatus Saccharibacteria bacterium]|nr:valine--tRNA ligase [Candidatus Saccharibacteria bacterium]
MKLTSSYEPDKFESDIYSAWESSGAFSPTDSSRTRERAGGLSKSDESVTRDEYSIVMPPPNANGNLHIGHGLTIAIEDSLTRYYRLKGNNTWYIPGADHAGFETWVVYERALEAVGHTRFEYSRDELYAKVWDFVQEQRGNMELQVRALGASCAWNDLTFTLDENVVARVYKTFEKMWNDGMIYRGEKLVNYCPKHQTAFADIEVEHLDEPGHLWDIKYEVAGAEPNCAFRDNKEPQPAVENTLTPFSEHELASARKKQAVKVSFDDGDEAPVEKSVIGSSPSYIVVSTTRPETLFGDQAVAVNPNDERYKDLIGKFVKLPLTDRTIPIIADEHADPTYGTGAVKITPAHDFDDFEVGKRHNLENLRVIGDDGKMLETAGKEYAGLTTEECRQKVLNRLEEQGLLLGSHEISHSVAHCYKCGTVIEPTLKEQWFIDVEKLAKIAIDHLKKGEIKFYPENKKQVLINYLKGLKDWNISRQIPWGIPIPMFKKTEAVSGTGKEHFDDTPDWIFDTRTNLETIEVGGVKYQRDEDTFDTWFSSSHWPIVTTDWTEQHGSPFYPLNVMETGADILFAWVARMIMMGLYVTGEVPFKEVYLHGLVLDSHGKKMSKSKGNVINPMDLVAKYGSDAFRLGILRGRSAGLAQAFSEDSVVASRNLCNKLWNIARLIDSWADAESNESISTDNMGEDWICRELDNLRKHLEKYMKSYRFAEAVEDLYSTIWDKYADWFLESQKGIKNLPLLKKTLENLLIMAHPFMPFVTETIWQALSWTDGMIITQKWPASLVYDPISAENFERLMLTVSEARKVLAGLGDTVKGISVGLLYGDDALVADNSELVRQLTRTDFVKPTDGTPKGIRLALPGREVYLDVSEKVVKHYKDQLTERILKVGRELDALNARMLNPNYVQKAPANLVAETKKGITEKEELIKRLKLELEVIN